jgi:hypothetical protein
VARLIIIAGPVVIDGTVYEDGTETGDLSDEQAQPLVACGACSVLLDAPADPPKRKPKELPAAE